MLSVTFSLFIHGELVIQMKKFQLPRHIMINYLYQCDICTKKKNQQREYKVLIAEKAWKFPSDMNMLDPNENIAKALSFIPSYAGSNRESWTGKHTESAFW